MKSTTRHIKNSIPIYRELISFIPKNRLESFERKVSLEYNPKLIEFYNGLIHKKWHSDIDASTELYSQPHSKSYNKLKRTLRTKLLVEITQSTVSSTKGNTNLISIYKNLNLHFVAYNLLRVHNYSVSAAYIGELLIASSINHGFSEFVPKAASELVEHFSISDLKPKKADYYSSVLKEYSNIIYWENLANLTHAKFINLFIKELNPGDKAQIIADDFLSEASIWEGKLNSAKFHARFYTIKIYRYYGQKEYRLMEQTANKAVNYFRSLKFRQPSVENNFLKKRVEANLIMGELLVCEHLLLEILNQTQKGKKNWYNTLEIQITLNLYQRAYNNAILNFLIGKKNKYFDTIPSSTAQRWGLLEAYINFLQLSGAVPESPTMSRYRINKFINETPRYSDDKKGRNIQLIIAQLLFYILDKNWIKMEEKIEALQRYSSRYLRKNDLFRSHVFIKMLLEIPKRQYHPKAILRHTAKYRKRLGEMKPNIELNGNTLEIIPYEDLWELIIQNIVPPKYTRVPRLSNSTITI